jgi:hypothetical protein
MAKRIKKDPVFAQIARHRRAEDQYSKVAKRLDNNDREKSPQDKRDLERAVRAEVRAMAAFLVPPPTTLEGFVAGISYLSEPQVSERLGFSVSEFENPFIYLARSPALRKHGEGEART